MLVSVWNAASSVQILYLLIFLFFLGLVYMFFVKNYSILSDRFYFVHHLSTLYSPLSIPLSLNLFQKDFRLSR